jgi:hypothetical protein
VRITNVSVCRHLVDTSDCTVCGSVDTSDGTVCGSVDTSDSTVYGSHSRVVSRVGIWPGTWLLFEVGFMCA